MVYLILKEFHYDVVVQSSRLNRSFFIELNMSRTCVKGSIDGCAAPGVEVVYEILELEPGSLIQSIVPDRVIEGSADGFDWSADNIEGLVDSGALESKPGDVPVW